MNDQRVKTDNEVIAEFMGFSSFETEQDRFWNPPHKGPARLEDWMYHTNQLDDFETSWDWLMPVVEKINETNQATIYETQYDNYGWYCYFSIHPISGPGQWKHFYYAAVNLASIRGSTTRLVCNSKIEAVYKAVVEFIHWYQKQKSS